MPISQAYGDEEGINMKPFVTIILAGGKGTRMGSSQKHKVCFEVLGVPVIIRALETYNLCGSQLNIIVVGMMAESVMATVNHRFPGVVYAFQEQARGTGHAARKAAEVLERMRFDGDVLVVAGDKLIEPHVIRRLMARHQANGADVTLASARRPPNSSTGILLSTARGNIVGILEEAERQRLVALRRLSDVLREHGVITREHIEAMLVENCREKAASMLREECGRILGDGEMLRQADWDRAFGPDERAGMLRVGAARIPGEEVLSRFDQMNLSTYVFRAPVLCDALQRLRPARPGGEVYLTDIFGILAGRKPRARVVACEIADAHDLMAFNNPQELLAIEEVYRRREEFVAIESAPPEPRTLATVPAWESLLEAPSTEARRQFRRWYGEEPPLKAIAEVVAAFRRRFGGDQQIMVVRSPGRINLLGRHIDHQGGVVNVMAINREIFLVAAPRHDDRVRLANVDETHFPGQEFCISDLVASLDWDDWQRVIDSPRLQRMLEVARGDWANYVKAAILRLQEQFRDRQLRGLDLMVGGDIPMGAGLSSSSALVVATAEAVSAFNRLPVSARRLVSLCGEGEWFVGTRGGAADHAAIKLSHRGYVTRVSFFPFEIGESAPFFLSHDLIVCNSTIYAGKSHRARNTFNAKVTAYHIGRAWCRMLRPDLAGRIQHLRDVSQENLGLDRRAFGELLGRIPQQLTRGQVQATLAQMAPPDRDRIERLFHSHDAPAGGYPVRDVVLFGLSEMARARHCLGLLKAGQAAELGRLMLLSHDGDRVSRRSPGRRWAAVSMTVSDESLGSWAEAAEKAPDMGELTGAYGCSLPEIDRIVDVARELPGVEGAQLAGAGLGGCVMVLVQRGQTTTVLKGLRKAGIEAEVFRPIAGACCLKLI